jgi:tyrosyl-tRNA synthetase
MSAQPPKPAPIVLSPEAQATFDLITRDLDEVLLPEIIKEKLANGEVVKCYWGTAPTGRRMYLTAAAVCMLADKVDDGKRIWDTLSR